MRKETNSGAGEFKNFAKSSLLLRKRCIHSCKRGISLDMAYVLTINTGSSSIKASLFEEDKSVAAYQILLSGIGSDDGMFSIKSLIKNLEEKKNKVFKTYEDAFHLLIQWLNENDLEKDVRSIGHRLVHGGAKYREPVLITSAVFNDLEKLIPFDPLHIPPELEGVKLMGTLFPNTLQVACFDTAFHATLPEISRIFAIPYRYAIEEIFRYGFHGLSFESVMDVLRKEGKLPEKLIIAHLGSGCSMAAVKDGKSIDTTMGFTPAGGLVMGTRSGDLDPGLLAYLLLEKKIDAKKLNHMINFESGLKGISGKSSEMKELLEAKDKRAKLAVDIFCYQIKKTIGAYSAVLGGLDMLVFTGGIGENSKIIRDKICQNLEFIGIKTSIDVKVINANEEKMIAKHTQEVLNQEVKT